MTSVGCSHDGQHLHGLSEPSDGHGTSEALYLFIVSVYTREQKVFKICVADACNPSSQEAGTRELVIQGQCGLHSKILLPSLYYKVKSCF